MTNISFEDITYLLIFLIPILIINYIYEIKQNTKILISIFRMGIQLFVVGLYFTYLFRINNEFVNIMYMILIVIVSSFTIYKSADLNKRSHLNNIFISLILPNFIIVMFFNYFVLSLDHIFEARYVVTIGGMILGNVQSSNIIGINSFLTSIRDNRQLIDYKLCLGATKQQATRQYFKNAIEVTMKLSIASLSTVGLVHLPGMMTGQILAGYL